MKKGTAAMISIILLYMFCAGLSAAENVNDKDPAGAWAEK